MIDYQKMYYTLCRAASEALDILPDTVENAPCRAVLQKALLEAEEVYIDGHGDK